MEWKPFVFYVSCFKIKHKTCFVRTHQKKNKIFVLTIISKQPGTLLDIRDFGLFAELQNVRDIGDISV